MGNDARAMRTFNDFIIKDQPGLGTVHVASAMPRQRRGRKNRGQMPLSMIGAVPMLAKNDQTSAVSFHVPITKVDDSLRTVYGWASVSSADGAMVTDHQDDQISDGEIVKAAHEFMASSRLGGLLHARDDAGMAHRGGEIVESLVLSADIQKALGVELGRTGWFIGYRVADDDAWALVKDGTLKAFSIGGRASRVPL